MECVEKNLGINKEVSSFVLPIGATINMMEQVLPRSCGIYRPGFRIRLRLVTQLGVILTATLASIAAVPSAGIVMLWYAGSSRYS